MKPGTWYHMKITRAPNQITRGPDSHRHRRISICVVLHGARRMMAKVLSVNLVHTVHVVVGNLSKQSQAVQIAVQITQ